MIDRLNSLFYSASLTIFRLIGGFLLVKVVAIHSGPQGVALFGQIQSYSNAIIGITTSPLGSGLTKNTVEKFKKGNDACSPWWKASLAWTGLLNFFTTVLGITFSRQIAYWLFSSTEYEWVIFTLAAIAPVSFFGTLIPSVINGRLDFKRYAITGIISITLSTLLAMFIIYKFGGIKGALISAILIILSNSTFLIILNLNQKWFKLKYWIGKVDLKIFLDIGKYVLMALTSAVCVPISIITVRNILINNVGLEVAGYWQSVYRISEVYLSIITVTLSAYYLPKITLIKDYCELKKEIIKNILFITPITIILAILIYLFRIQILIIGFSVDFIKAENLFFIQLIGDIVKIVAWMLAYVLISRGNYKIYIMTEIFFSILLTIVCNFFIKKIGVQGANVGYVITYCIYLIFMIFNFKKNSQINE